MRRPFVPYVFACASTLFVQMHDNERYYYVPYVQTIGMQVEVAWLVGEWAFGILLAYSKLEHISIYLPLRPTRPRNVSDIDLHSALSPSANLSVRTPPCKDSPGT